MSAPESAWDLGSQAYAALIALHSCAEKAERDLAALRSRYEALQRMYRREARKAGFSLSATDLEREIDEEIRERAEKGKKP